MKIKQIAFVFLFSLTNTLAQSYEGYIFPNLPVWVDLNPAAPDGSLSGSYFYKLKGKAISLSGEKIGNKLTLTEKIDDEKITGHFNLTDYGDSITGTWHKPKSLKYLVVRIFKTDESFKAVARIPSPDKLLLADEGRSLKDRASDYSEEGQSSSIYYSFAEKGIISIDFSWEIVSPRVLEGVEDYTFDVSACREIVLRKEIKNNLFKEFLSRIRIQLQKDLNKFKKTFPEEEWLEAFPNKAALDSAFTVKNLSEYLCRDFYLKDHELHISFDRYFGLPHPAIDKEFFGEVKIPFSELQRYLNDDSVLRKLR